MILAHEDSNGNVWYFRFTASREVVARIARKLVNKAVRVKQARGGSELSRAMLAEAVALADLQAYNAATPEEWNAAPRSERFIV